MGGIVFIAEPHPWIPAFAGMTELCKGLLRGKKGDHPHLNPTPQEEEGQASSRMVAQM